MKTTRIYSCMGFMIVVFFMTFFYSPACFASEPKIAFVDELELKTGDVLDKLYVVKSNGKFSIEDNARIYCNGGGVIILPETKDAPVSATEFRFTLSGVKGGRFYGFNFFSSDSVRLIDCTFSNISLKGIPYKDGKLFAANTPKEMADNFRLPVQERKYLSASLLQAQSIFTDRLLCFRISNGDSPLYSSFTLFSGAVIEMNTTKIFNIKFCFDGKVVHGSSLFGNGARNRNSQSSQNDTRRNHIEAMATRMSQLEPSFIVEEGLSIVWLSDCNIDNCAVGYCYGYQHCVALRTNFSRIDFISLGFFNSRFLFIECRLAKFLIQPRRILAFQPHTVPRYCTIFMGYGFLIDCVIHASGDGSGYLQLQKLQKSGEPTLYSLGSDDPFSFYSMEEGELPPFVIPSVFCGTGKIDSCNISSASRLPIISSGYVRKRKGSELLVGNNSLMASAKDGKQVWVSFEKRANTVKFTNNSLRRARLSSVSCTINFDMNVDLSKPAQFLPTCDFRENEILCHGATVEIASAGFAMPIAISNNEFRAAHLKFTNIICVKSSEIFAKEITLVRCGKFTDNYIFACHKITFNGMNFDDSKPHIVDNFYANDCFYYWLDGYKKMSEEEYEARKGWVQRD